MPKLGVVIPTIFQRPEYLPLAIESIRNSTNAFILLSSPKSTQLDQYIDLVDAWHEEPAGNLAFKIDHALKALPEEIEFITWLGDDDLITQEINKSIEYLEQNPETVLVYGSCDYINMAGNKIGQNPSGNWAKKLMHFGPFLIPQPGSVWRRGAFESIGGIPTDMDMAFDFDLFISLKQVGDFHFINQTTASFRWHPGSLSASKRTKSVMEAHRVRRKHYKGLAKLTWPIWEWAVITATFFAGRIVSIRLSQ